MPNSTVRAAAPGLPSNWIDLSTVPDMYAQGLEGDRMAPTFTTVRRALSDEIDRLIYLLDMIDGDTDLEPQCEDEGAQCEDEGAQDDREWSLGSLSGHINQDSWAHGNSNDLEAGVEEMNLQHFLNLEAQASRDAAACIGDVIARLTGVPAGSAVHR